MSAHPVPGPLPLHAARGWDGRAAHTTIPHSAQQVTELFGAGWFAAEQEKQEGEETPALRPRPC